MVLYKPPELQPNSSTKSDSNSSDISTPSKLVAQLYKRRPSIFEKEVVHQHVNINLCSCNWRDCLTWLLPNPVKYINRKHKRMLSSSQLIIPEKNNSVYLSYDSDDSDVSRDKDAPENIHIKYHDKPTHSLHKRRRHSSLHPHTVHDLRVLQDIPEIPSPQVSP